MLYLHHNEGHFYIVQHGSLFVDWNARPGPAMRELLDSVHRHVDVPVLDAAHYDPESLFGTAVAEEAAILE